MSAAYSKKKSNRYNSGQGDQNKMARSLDALAEYEEMFFNVMAPKVRRMVAAGKTATEIYKLCEGEMAARLLTIAMTEKDPKVAMAAIKEAHDRSLGKAKETLEVNNRFEKMTDDELDRLIKSQEEQLADAEKH